MKKCYSNPVISQVPRLITHIDRNKYSPTYGCCTRDFWHYRLLDIPNSQTQTLALTLSLIYKKKYPGNRYFHDKDIKEWAIASMIYWTKIQHKNGSFDEVYMNQNSYAATAFTTYSISESLLLLGDIKGKEVILNALKKSSGWLINTKEVIAINQIMVSIAAIYNVYLLTKEKFFLERVKEKLRQLSDSQTDEGWFNEYGGADIGYTALGLDYLAKYWSKSGDKTVYKILEKMLYFLSHFLHPNGTVGGEYGSRNTEYLFPHAFELLAKKNKTALQIRDYLLSALKNKKNVFLEKCLDDRYFIYMCYDYLQAYDDFCNKKVKTYTFRNIRKYFPEAGLFVYKNKNYLFITNLKKGGVFHMYSNNFNYVDSGLFGVLKNKSVITSQHLDEHAKITVSDNSLSIRSNFFRLPRMISSPSIQLCMKSFNLIAPHRVRRIFLDVLRKKAVSAKSVDVRFSRNFRLLKESLVIEDVIKTNEKFRSIKPILNKIKAMHFASTSFFQPQELDLFNHKIPNLTKRLNKNGKTKLIRKINVVDKKVKVIEDGILECH